MSEGAVLAVAAVVLSTIGTIITLVKFGIQIAGMEERISKDLDKKLSRVYERLDEVKRDHDVKMENMRRDFDERFVEIKLCKIVTNNQDKAVTEIKDSIANIYTEIKEINCKLGSK